ncbi:MAG: gene transfer agent family protein [Hyphomicrobiaceae bacterium]
MSSQHGLVTLDWADGTYAFRLSLAGIEELEEKLDLSVFTLAHQLRLREARLKGIVETLRIGLIGGGMEPVRALTLVRRYVDERPIDENRDTAYAVVLAGLARVGPGELAEAKKKTRRPGPPRRRNSASTSAPSAVPPP